MKFQRSHAGFCSSLAKSFFLTPGATTHHLQHTLGTAWRGRSRYPQIKSTDVLSLCAVASMSDCKGGANIPILSFPARIYSPASSSQVASEFPAASWGPAALSSPLDADLRKAGRIAPNLPVRFYAANTTGTHPVCGSFSNR